MNIRKPVFALSVAGLVALPALASAQSQMGATSETGTLITRRLAQVRGETTLEARKTLREFATCAAAGHPGIVEAAIDDAVDTKSYRRKLIDVSNEDCFSSGEMQMPAELLRGALFEAMYLREFGDAPNPDLTSAASYDYSAPYSKPLSEEAQNTVGLAIVGDCVTRTASEKVHALLASVPGSPAEDRGFAEVAKILPGCVPPNKTFRFSRSVVRGSVAEALLRLSRSAQAAGKASASK
jgi:hypothetical protein